MRHVNYLICSVTATLLVILGLAASTGFSDEPKPEKTKVIVATIPTGEWLGWGTTETPGWANTPPKPGEVEIFDALPGSPRTFSGRVVGIDGCAGVEVGLVSLKNVYWMKDDTYIWQPVNADGTFLLTDVHYADQNKCVVVRAPGRPWSFCEYIFKAPQCGRNMVVHCDIGRQVTLTAHTGNAKDPANFSVSVFAIRKGWVHRSHPLGYQYAGSMESRDGKLTVALPAEPVALYIIAKGTACDYEILDPREADSFDITLMREGCIDGTVLRDDKPVANTQVDVWNGAAAFSERLPTTDEHGHFRCNGLAPGTYSLSCANMDSQTDVHEGETTQVTLHLPPVAP